MRHRFLGSLIFLAGASISPEAGAAPPEVRPDGVVLSREGYQATASARSVQFRVLSYLWELTTPDSVGFWILAEPRGGAVVRSFGRLGDEASVLPIESIPYGDAGPRLFCFSVARNRLSGSFLEIDVSADGSDATGTNRLTLAAFVGDAPPPIDLSGLRFLVDHVLTETDSTYDVAVSCELTNTSPSDKRLWVRFSAHEAVFAPSKERVKAYLEEQTRRAREAWKSGETICEPALPWDFIRGHVERGETINAPVLLHAGGTCAGSFTIVWKKREVAAWSPGELTATIEMEGRKVEDPPTDPRLRSLLHVLAVPVPE